jgi:hypothetical protein
MIIWMLDMCVVAMLAPMQEKTTEIIIKKVRLVRTWSTLTELEVHLTVQHIQQGGSAKSLPSSKSDIAA